MKICAVICEYNPFHYGHAYQIEKIKEKYDRVVCIMSGNFTQRAEPAIIDKYVRATQALQNGADMIIQLPTLYACSSAQFFAKGAINVLRNLPIDAISFGMENDNVDILTKIAQCEKNEEYKSILKSSLEQGNSYISSCVKAITQCLSSKDETYVTDFLSKPNNMLAIEYVKAINEYGLKWDIFPVKRNSDYNSNSLSGKFVSASAIREAYENSIDVSKFIPNYELFATIPKADLKTFKAIQLSTLRLQDEKSIIKLSNAGEGLENKLTKNALTCSTLDETLEKTKSKRYSFARIKRLALDCVLDLKKEDIVFPDKATAIMLAVKNDFIPYLKQFSPYLITENSQLSSFIPQSFVKIEEHAEKIYSTICSTPYNGIIKKLVKA